MFDLDAARKAGYSDDVIADGLAKEQGVDIGAARQAGYSAADMLPGLMNASPKGGIVSSAMDGISSATDTIGSGLSAARDWVSSTPNQTAAPTALAGAGRGSVNPALVDGGAPPSSGSTWNDIGTNLLVAGPSLVAKSLSTFAGIAGADDVAQSLKASQEYWDGIAKEHGSETTIGHAANIVGSVLPAIVAAPEALAGQLAMNAGLFGIPAFKESLQNHLDRDESYGSAVAHAAVDFTVNMAMPVLAGTGGSLVGKALIPAGASALTRAAIEIPGAGAVFGGLDAAGQVLDKGIDTAIGNENNAPWIDPGRVASSVIAGSAMHVLPMVKPAAGLATDAALSKVAPNYQAAREMARTMDAGDLAPDVVETLNPNLRKTPSPDPIARVMASDSVDSAIAAAQDSLRTPSALDSNDQSYLSSQAQQDIADLNAKENASSPAQTLTPDEIAHRAYLTDALNPDTDNGQGGLGTNYDAIARKLGYTPGDAAAIAPTIEHQLAELQANKNSAINEAAPADAVTDPRLTPVSKRSEPQATVDSAQDAIKYTAGKGLPGESYPAESRRLTTARADQQNLDGTESLQTNQDQNSQRGQFQQEVAQEVGSLADGSSNPKSKAETSSAVSGVDPRLIHISQRNAPLAPVNTSQVAIDNVAKNYAKWFENVGQKFKQEQWAQDVLDSMEDHHESPQQVAESFWTQTYPRMNEQTQAKFKSLYKGHTGHTLETGDNPMDMMDLGNKAEHLEGTDRGFVALMREGNSQSQVMQPAIDPRLIPPSKRADLSASEHQQIHDANAQGFESLYQQGVKDDIQLRLGLLPPDPQAAATASPFRSFLREYGINKESAKDVTGENSVFRAHSRLPNTFRDNGLGLDLLVHRAVERGFMPASDMESGNDNGGVNRLTQMIQAEIRGKRQLPIDGQNETAAAQADRVQRLEIEGRADKLGLPYSTDTSTDQLASMVNRVETRLEKEVDVSFNGRGSLKSERVLANARDAALKIEKKRAQYARESRLFDEANISEQDALLAVLTDADGHPVITRKSNIDAAKAWAESQEHWNEQHGQTDTADQQPGLREDQALAAGKPEESAGHDERTGAEAQPGSDQAPRADGKGQKGLVSPSRADVLAQQERTANSDRAEKAHKKAQDLIDKKERERKDIAKASEGAADSFTLGGDAMENLTGQGSMFDAPSDQITETKATLDANNVTGKERLDVIKDVKSGALTVAEIQEAYPAKIEDVGEKIGGARKDTAVSTGPGRAKKEADDRPAWERRFQIGQIAGGFDISHNGRDITGKWTISDTRNKDRLDQPKQMGGYFDSKEAAEAALPLLAVAQKHRIVSGDRAEDGTYRQEIWRDINDRKRVKVVDQDFATREDAMRYMAEHAKDIIETNTTFGEADLPRPENTDRTGVERRAGDVQGKDFQDAFGMRGVEFGNWNNQDERQQVMNAAYDGLMDLADVVGIPPKAIGLNGDLALAFGARGQGLNSAVAHYERNRAVINLTKMNGAGALAHEWFHGLDHYFGRQDGKAASNWKINPDGTKSFDIKGAENDMASGGFGYKSGVREEVRDAYKTLIQTLFTKAAHYVEDTQKADKFVGRAREDMAKRLDDLRKDLSEQKDIRYYKRNNKPASAEQLMEFDTVAQALLDGNRNELTTDYRATDPDRAARMGLSGRFTNDSLDKISSIYKEVRGRSGFGSVTDRNGVMDHLRSEMSRYGERLKMLADAQNATTKTKQTPTNFAMDAKSLDQGRGGDYWTTPHEMAARTFQGYVEDMIAAKGGKSPFLNHAPENAGILTPWGAKRPYPAGDERIAMNKSFDAFVKTIKTRETEQGTAMFSRSNQEHNDYQGEQDYDFTQGNIGSSGDGRIIPEQKLETTVGGKPAAEGWSSATRISRAASPVSVFRGARIPLDSSHFQPENLGRSSGNPSSGLGVWFTTGKTEASNYGKSEAFHLDIRNPKVIKAEDLPGFDSIDQAIQYRKSLQAQGYDGIIVTAKHLGKPEAHIVAFDPEQVIRPKPDAQYSEHGAVRNPSTVEHVQSAISDFIGGKQLQNQLGRVVSTTASEIKSYWEPLINKSVNIGSEGEAGVAQAFYDPRTKTVFLIADHISQGNETAVLAHELMHKHGQEVLGKDGWDRLHGVISSWEHADRESEEYAVYSYARGKVAAVGEHLSSQELFPYAVEAALKIGIKPSMAAKQGTVVRWLESVRQNMQQVWGKITGRPETFKTQDLVNLAFGIAQRENPAHAGVFDTLQTKPSAADGGGVMFSMEKPENTKEMLHSVMEDALRATAPIGVAPSEARASIKQYSNDRRLAQYRFGEADEFLKKNFTEVQQEKMWQAADEENDLRRTAASPSQMAGRGLDSLTPPERTAVMDLHNAGNDLFSRAKAVGLISGDGVPFWTPRMMVMVDPQTGEFSAPISSAKGVGQDSLRLSTNAASAKFRKYDYSADTQAAMQAKGGDLVKNIRAMPMAMSRLESAIAGRELVNEIKTLGQNIGQEWISSSAKDDFVVANHPAFSVVRPRFEQDSSGNPILDQFGHMIPKYDAEGNPIMDRQHLYVRRDIDAALRAALSSSDGKVYTGLMLLKSKAMSGIMVSPLIHNMVIAGKALAMHPTNLPMMYARGYLARKNPALVEGAIHNGLVLLAQHNTAMDVTDLTNPIGKEGGLGDINESWLAHGARGALRLAGMPNAGEAVKAGIDKAGDFWHGTLLWNRIADLQMGLYQDAQASLVKKGYTERAAGLMAAHIANRYGGALPKENMSEMSRKFANITLFSRSFTLGNIGIMKDVLTGLPSGEKALLQREMGVDARTAVNAMRKKAFVGLVVDAAFAAVALSMFQDLLDPKNKNRPFSDVLGDYSDRAGDMLKNLMENPGHPGSYNPLRLFSQDNNEPGKQTRAFSGVGDDGRGLYIRLPTGKVIEELFGWTSHPSETLAAKLSPTVKSIYQAGVNDAGFGHPVYDESDNTAKIALDIAAHLVKSHFATDAAVRLYDYAKGISTDKDKLALQGTLTGLTPSTGFPGGPESGVIAKSQRDYKMTTDIAKVKALRELKNGNRDEAENMLSDAGMLPKEIHAVIRKYENPKIGVSKSAGKWFGGHSSEAQKAQRETVNQ